MFALKLPATITEKEDKYEAQSSEDHSPTPVSEEHGLSTRNSEQGLENILPLPGMPTGKDDLQQLNSTISEDIQVCIAGNKFWPGISVKPYFSE